MPKINLLPWRDELRAQRRNQFYMAMGGVPLYLEQSRRGESAAQIIDRVCFAEDGLLRDEFSQLYPALFEGAQRHIQIVRALASKASGLTRKEVAEATGQSPSGRLTALLDELVESGFVQNCPPYGKRVKDALFRLSDEYSLFYLRWIERWRGAYARMDEGGIPLVDTQGAGVKPAFGTATP